MAITKATLSVLSYYNTATELEDQFEPPIPGQLDLNNWGCITLWDIRPWLLPSGWTSRPLLGPLGWEGYLGRPGVMDSIHSPNYDPISQYGKWWAEMTRTVDIYDVSLAFPYAYCSAIGSPPFSYSGGVAANHDVAFDISSVASLCSTLTLAIYAYNSATPATQIAAGMEGDETSELGYFNSTLDVWTSDGQHLRGGAHTYTIIPPGPPGYGYLGGPTDVVYPENSIDQLNETYTLVRESVNAQPPPLQLFGALWHPLVLLLTNWILNPVVAPDGGPRNHSFLGVMAMGSGADASFVG